jgi:hypothetical protein
MNRRHRIEIITSAADGPNDIQALHMLGAEPLVIVTRLCSDDPTGPRIIDLSGHHVASFVSYANGTIQLTLKVER